MKRMAKLVVLKLDGDLNQHGFKAILEIGEEGQRPDLELLGQLPADRHLAESLQNHWHIKYRQAGSPHSRKAIAGDRQERLQKQFQFLNWRIRPGKATYDGHLTRIKECQESALELEEQFQKWLRSETFQSLDLRLREELSKDEEIRFLVRTDDNQIKKLPWHLWDFCRRYARSEVALSSLSSVNYKKSQLSFKDKVRILAILGHREGIDIDRDRRFLEGLPQSEVTFLVEPKRQQINDKLWEQPWDIIFFAGHSETEGETGKIYINPEESLEMRDLWYGLRKAVDRGLKLAIFNSCDGLGLAQRLDDYEIPVAIVMRELVPDKVAQEFLKYFLDRFVNGMPFHLAVREAREQLQGLESEFPCASWLPVICQSPAAFYPTWVNLETEEDTVETPFPTATENPKPAPEPILKKWQALLLTSILTTSLVMGVRSLGLLEFFELKAYDAFMQMRPAEPQDDRILIVSITEKDLYNQPDRGNASISDRNLELVLAKLDALGARTIGLSLIRNFTTDPQYPELAHRLANSPNFIGACYSGLDKPDFETLAPPPEIQDIDRIGFGNISEDVDGVIRRQILRQRPDAPCDTSISLSLKVAMHYLQQMGVQVTDTSQNYIKIGDVVLTTLEKDSGGYHELDSRGDQIMLNYRAGKTVARRVSLGDVLEDKIDPEWVKDRIVLIGTTASIQAKVFSTPIFHQGLETQNRQMPGVLIDAHQVSQIVSAVLDDRPLIHSWRPGQKLLWVFAWSIAGALLAVSTLKRHKFIAFFIIASFGCAILGISYWLLPIYGLWVPFIPAILSFVGSVTILIYLAKTNKT
mgnify:CR=1 FL=1